MCEGAALEDAEVLEEQGEFDEGSRNDVACVDNVEVLSRVVLDLQHQQQNKAEREAIHTLRKIIMVSISKVKKCFPNPKSIAVGKVLVSDNVHRWAEWRPYI
jgi:hypothetical protein